ncbi:hypothetical protein MK079_01850 [Candidatus Gracilibacteria bacterium]|nr:hypothetical protein [Candidatus Gracilibacteria bacterium]
MGKIEQTLENLGLNINEVKIYMLGLQTGPAAASILAKKCGLPRSTVQYTCQSLVKKGVFSLCPKGNSFIFSPEDPEKLQSLIDKQYNSLDSKVRDLQHIMGDLKDMINPHASMPKVKYYQGVDGMIEMLNDSMKENGNKKDIKSNIAYSIKASNLDINPEIMDYIEKTYVKNRIKNNVILKTILNEDDKNIQRQKEDKKANRISLLTPENLYHFPSTIQIFGNKVAFISSSKGDTTGVLIENSHISKSMLSIFKLAWDKARMLPINNQYKEIEL